MSSEFFSPIAAWYLGFHKDFAALLIFLKILASPASSGGKNLGTLYIEGKLPSLQPDRSAKGPCRIFCTEPNLSFTEMHLAPSPPDT